MDEENKQLKSEVERLNGEVTRLTGELENITCQYNEAVLRAEKAESEIKDMHSKFLRTTDEPEKERSYSNMLRELR